MAGLPFFVGFNFGWGGGVFSIQYMYVNKYYNINFYTKTREALRGKDNG